MSKIIIWSPLKTNRQWTKNDHLKESMYPDHIKKQTRWFFPATNKSPNVEQFSGENIHLENWGLVYPMKSQRMEETYARLCHPERNWSVTPKKSHFGSVCMVYLPTKKIHEKSTDYIHGSVNIPFVPWIQQWIMLLWEYFQSLKNLNFEAHLNTHQHGLSSHWWLKEIPKYHNFGMNKKHRHKSIVAYFWATNLLWWTGVLNHHQYEFQLLSTSDSSNVFNRDFWLLQEPILLQPKITFFVLTKKCPLFVRHFVGHLITTSFQMEDKNTWATKKALVVYRLYRGSYYPIIWGFLKRPI